MRGTAVLLEDIVLRHAPEPARPWLLRVRPKAGEPVPALALRAAVAGAGRRLGAAPPALSDEERAALAALGVVAPERWPLDALARVDLISAALRSLPEAEHVGLVRELYRRGDYAEQAAVLRGLVLLPEPGRFVELAIEACRTNVLDVFEAAACENAYPARYFPEPAFNHMVLKALFMGVALARVEDLASRRNPELRRMAADYASERRHAHRPVPDDIDLALA